MKLKDTPVDSISMFNRDIFIKRDDLLHPEFAGNKARKFAYFLDHDFAGVSKLIGYGSPQANSLYSMSALAKLKGWKLDFYVDHIASHVKTLAAGNYFAACANGANVIDLSELADREGRDTLSYIQQVVLEREPDAVFVPEGGRCSYAEYGVSMLAGEISRWAAASRLDDLIVFLPSGTGTTALFLNKYFVEHGLNIRVLTCAVVGGDAYLKLQFSELTDNPDFYPQIVSMEKKYHFGKLYREYFEMWHKVSKSGITFELLYDPLGWLALEHHLTVNEENATVLYLHQGGVLGNESMLPRYRRKFNL